MPNISVGDTITDVIVQPISQLAFSDVTKTFLKWGDK